MLNFEFFNPTKILFGQGQIAKLEKEIPKGAKVLILYGGGSVKKTGLLNAVKLVLKDYEVGEFGGIEPNPTYETLMKAAMLARKEQYDFLLAVGGGSVIDGTKFVAAAISFAGEDPWKILSERIALTEAVSFGTVLTLPATGSEMNSGAVITHKGLRAKLAFHSQVVFPRFSILDPTFTYSLPKKQIGNGIVDTFVHVMEQYLTYPVNAKVQDRFAEGLLLTLIEDGSRVLTEMENYDIRANLMWAATLGLNGLIGAGVPQDWATHMIGHEITALFGLDHAQTLAIILPAMLEVLKREKQHKLIQYAERVWGIKEECIATKVDYAIDKTREFFIAVGLPTRLSDYGLGQEIIPEVIAGLEAHKLTRLGEHGTVTPDIVEKILIAAL